MDEAAYLTGPERLLCSISAVFLDGKFLNALAFLFGFGLALQGTRASGRLLARRLGALALFGAAHALFVWSGDVLLVYALLGFLLLPFLRLRPRALLLLAGVAFAVALAASAVWLLVPEASGAAVRAAGAASFSDLASSAQDAYGSGSFAQMTAQRARELAFTYSTFYVIGPPLLAMMFLGAAAARAGWLRELGGPGPGAKGIRRAAVLGVSLGLPLNALPEVVPALPPYTIPTFLEGTAFALLLQACSLLGPPVLALGYAALAALLLQRSPASAITRRLAEVGRMALSNYLLQSIIMTAIFYGAGLYGRVGPFAALLLCAFVYVANIAAGRFWLAAFPYGPAEQLWRRLTYGRRAP